MVVRRGEALPANPALTEPRRETLCQTANDIAEPRIPRDAKFCHRAEVQRSIVGCHCCRASPMWKGLMATTSAVEKSARIPSPNTKD